MRPAPTAPNPPKPLELFFLSSVTRVGPDDLPNQPVWVSLREAVPLPCLE